MSFPIEAQLTKLIDAGIAFSTTDNKRKNAEERNKQKLCVKTCTGLSSGLCRGMQWYLRRREGLCSRSSFPHHVVNGLWLVLSDAPALGYPTLMCSAQCFMLPSEYHSENVFVCAQGLARHKQKTMLVIVFRDLTLSCLTCPFCWFLS